MYIHSSIQTDTWIFMFMTTLPRCMPSANKRKKKKKEEALDPLELEIVVSQQMSCPLQEQVFLTMEPFLKNEPSLQSPKNKSLK